MKDSKTSLRQAQLKMLAMLKAVDSICQKHNLDYWLDGGTLLGAVRHQGFVPWDDDLDVAMPRTSFDAFRKIAPKELPASMTMQNKSTDVGYFNLKVPLKIRDNDSRYIVHHETGREPYHQGIYMDIFPFDKSPVSSMERRLCKFASRKLLRLLHHKYSPLYLYVGHNAWLYHKVARLLPKKLLEGGLRSIIDRVNRNDSDCIGYGFDCLNRNYFARDDFFPLKRARFEDGEFNIPNKADCILRHQFGNYLVMPPKHKRGMKHCRELIAHIEDDEQIVI